MNTKLCECGCNQPVGLAKRNGPHAKKGEPLKFLPHHAGPYAARNKPSFHGMTGTPTHGSWLAMIERCTSPKHQAWHNYGGRGIAVCERWRNFRNFLKDMGERPAGKSLDRKDVNGNYTPRNCRWATSMEQHANYRSNHVLTHAGKTQHVSAWARDIGIHHSSILSRLERGWSIAKTLTTPPRRC